MSLIRWLSVALATLTTTAAANAQTAPLAALGVTAVFGQEASNEAVSPDTALLPGFVPACLECWTEQLGSLACHFQPLTLPAQQAMVISEVVQAIMAAKPTDELPNPTDELLRGLTSFKNGYQSTSGPNIIWSVPGGVSNSVIAADLIPASQACKNGQQVKAASKSCCSEAGCRAAASTAKTCPACQASQKVKQDIAALLVSLQRLQTQMAAAQSQQCPACTATVGATSKANCCCAKASQVKAQACQSGTCCAATPTAVKPVIAAGTCACAQGCGCCQSAGAANKTSSIVVSPAPFLMVQKVTSGDSTFTFLDELQGFLNPPMPAHVYNSNPVLSAPPVFFASSAVPPPTAYTVPQQPFACPVPFSPPLGVSPAPDGAMTVSREAPAQAALKHNVHLVTPQMEAHCERLTSAGNGEHIILEGDVQLTCNRNGQTIRIQGQRVIVHLSDGTFTVESASEFRAPVPVSRVRAVVKPGVNLQTIPYRELAVPPGAVSPSYYSERPE